MKNLHLLLWVLFCDDDKIFCDIYLKLLICPFTGEFSRSLYIRKKTCRNYSYADLLSIWNRFLSS